MRTLLFSILMLGISSAIWATDLVSPNAKIKVALDEGGCRVLYRDMQVLLIGNLTNPQSGGGQCKVGKARRIRDDYQMLTGKRLHCTNEANEYKLTVDNDKLTIIMRLYNDGIAFRYESANYPFSNIGNPYYEIPQGTRRWLQKWTDSYEGFYPLTTEATDGRWGFPALFEVKNKSNSDSSFFLDALAPRRDCSRGREGGVICCGTSLPRAFLRSSRCSGGKAGRPWAKCFLPRWGVPIVYFFRTGQTVSLVLGEWHNRNYHKLCSC